GDVRVIGTLRPQVPRVVDAPHHLDARRARTIYGRFHLHVRLSDRDGRAVVSFNPLIAMLDGERKTADGIVDAVEDTHRDRAGRCLILSTRATEQRGVHTRVDRDRGEDVWCVARQPGGHERATGVTLRVDPVRVDTPCTGNVLDDLAQV